MPELLMQLEYLLRIVIASLCGGLIGYERKKSLKEAGVRTHLLVAIACSLMMVVSKYGFMDVIVLDSVNLDPSRVAAGIVTGVGFLGAGMIFVRKQVISGLTTSAGVWATVGVGMAIGGGMYFIGITSTLLILLFQVILHRDIPWLHLPVTDQIIVQIDESNNAISYLQDILEKHGIELINIKAQKQTGGGIEAILFVKLPKAYKVSELMNLFRDNPYVKSIEL